MSEEQENKIKINDKRRFDESGNLKNQPDVKIEKTESTTKDSLENSEKKHFESEEISEAQSEVVFTSFLTSLATQALVLMGEIPAPEGVDMPVDKSSAKQTIDLIEVIKKKTEGNLSEQENYFIEEVLHSLRLSFIKHS